MTRRGRPRNSPDTLAKWTPPPGWGRLSVWVGPDERAALKRVAKEAGSSVSELVRALAAGLDAGVIHPREILDPAARGKAVMEKIPTLFERNDRFKVTPAVREECAWVLEGQGRATEKLDGMNVRLTIRAGTLVRLEKRRNPDKAQKKLGIRDGWYVDTHADDPADRYLLQAAANTDVSDWPDGEHAAEAMGPKIQGNPLNLERLHCVPFNLDIPDYTGIPLTFEGLRDHLKQLDSRYRPGQLAEGIVFHHPDGRRAKIKRKDFM